jgi:chromosome segregation protein
MFKLRRLEITGFKSFADHTDLIFTGEGITAIVGPNGCGKSNVADAIAWVLGEQRVKHLRGAEMKDVIFQGSRNRPPSGMSEVVLHLVRDEIIESEPDIEEIDEVLEEIDDQTIKFETSEVETAPAQISETEVTAIVDAVESSQPPQLTEAASADPSDQLNETPKSRTHHHRHWRRRNLALQFAPGEAISVTRRLFRSGESEYLLNDRPCRLRDIQDLFSGTGLSGGHYAIIEQGRIGQILSAKPMDRRTIIEEAAGITKFRVRQRAAESRLESARSNLSRVTDIISEIERQVNSLRRQAAKARRYRVLKEELRELLRQVYVAEEQNLAAVLAHAQTQLDSATEDDQRMSEELAEHEGCSREATQHARALEDELAQLRAAVAEAALQRDRRIRERVYQVEQIQDLEKRGDDIRSEIERLHARLVTIEAELERLQQLDLKLNEESQQTLRLLQASEAAHGNKLETISQIEREIEATRAELLTYIGAAERLHELARQLESALQKLAQQTEGLAREGERATAAHEARKADAEKLNQDIAAAKEKLARLQAEREAAVKTVVEGHERVSDTDAELLRLRDDHSRTLHKLESLKDLDQRRAHYSLAVQEAFTANEQEDFHFIGTLADAINADAQWERAVEGAFGAALQSIVVPTPDDAVRAAAWLRANQAGRATFMVAGLHGGSDETKTLINEIEDFRSEISDFKSQMNSGSSTGTATARQQYIPVGIDGPRIGNILRAPNELLAMLERTLPERMNARIVDTLDDAIALSLATGDMFVSTDGDWVAGGQFVNAGNGRAPEEGAGLLAFKRELRELETRAGELEAEVVIAEAAVKDARHRLTDLEESVVLLNGSIAREEREVMARELNAETLRQEVDRAARHMRVVVEDAERLKQEQLELEERRAVTLSKALNAEQFRRTAQERITESSNVLSGVRREAETESELLNKQRSEAATATERRRSMTADLRRLQTEREDVVAGMARHDRESVENAARLEELRASIGEIDRLAATVDEEKRREDQQISETTARLTSAREHADTLAAELAELNRRAAAARDARAAIEVQRAESLARLNFVRESCANELGHSLEDVARELSLDETFDLESGRARVDEMRERLENFGAVNMMALEELTEADERLSFLTTQRADIQQGIASTEEALREIKRRSRERFRDAFEKINKNFSELFLELFGGGRGEMSLIDADDELESGIDIVAQPPGKRLQNVLLLSGGEKAMAALALVLGIFHYRPAPFCLLDEVDAPLDEANIGRFTNKVVQMSAGTQFIVITHNKRTMETARALYGVTMEEVGVSKLVSVRFE